MLYFTSTQQGCPQFVIARLRSPGLDPGSAVAIHVFKSWIALSKRLRLPRNDERGTALPRHNDKKVKLTMNANNQFNIYPVKTLKDNYVWVMVNTSQLTAIVIDPGEA